MDGQMKKGTLNYQKINSLQKILGFGILNGKLILMIIQIMMVGNMELTLNQLILNLLNSQMFVEEEDGLEFYKTFECIIKFVFINLTVYDITIELS